MTLEGDVSLHHPLDLVSEGLAISWQGRGEPRGRTHPHAALFRKDAKGGSRKKEPPGSTSHTKESVLQGNPEKAPTPAPSQSKSQEASGTGVK